jgi:hypothetical protein
MFIPLPIFKFNNIALHKGFLYICHQFLKTLFGLNLNLCHLGYLLSEYGDEIFVLRGITNQFD